MVDTPSTPVVETRREQDPSPLVTQSIQRETHQLEQLLRTEINSLRSELDTRLDGMDKALTKVEQYPTAVDLAIARVREYFDEKIKGLHLLLEERDKRSNVIESANRELMAEQRLSSQTAIAKAEASMREQLASVAARADDLKARLIEVESRSKGANQLWALIVGGIGLIGVIVAIIVTVIKF